MWPEATHFIFYVLCHPEDTLYGQTLTFDPLFKAIKMYLQPGRVLGVTKLFVSRLNSSTSSACLQLLTNVW